MKRVISLLLTFVMILSMMTVSVMAAEPASVTAKADYTAKVINVVYNNTANYDCYVTIYMVDADEYDDDVFEDFGTNGSIIRMATVEAGASSEAKVTLVLGDDIKTGNYNIYAAPSGNNGAEYYAKIEAPLYIIGETADEGVETVAQVLEFINGGTENNISTRAYMRLRKALGLTGNPTWRNAYVYAIRANDFGGSFASITEVENALNIADAVYAIRNASSDTLLAAIEAGSETLGLDIENKDYKNEAYNSKILDAFAETIKDEDIKSKDAIVSAFVDSIAFTVINNGTVSEKAAAFSTYQKSLGISDALLALINDKGAEVVARHFEGFTAEKSSDVTTKVTDILAAIANEPSKDPVYVPQGGGNGGGSGFGSGVTIPNEYASQTTTPDYTTTFSDVPSNHWANAPVEYLASVGVLAGKGDGKFAPDSIVTREEFVKMIVSAFKYTNAGDGIEFADVVKGHWAYDYIKVAYENNIVKGISEDKFGIGSPITRQDMAVIIMRVVNDKKIELIGNASSFMDDDKIAGYAKESVMELVAGGILNGYSDGTFRPEGSLTRAEAAKVIYTLINR